MTISRPPSPTLAAILATAPRHPPVPQNECTGRGHSSLGRQSSDPCAGRSAALGMRPHDGPLQHGPAGVDTRDVRPLPRQPQGPAPCAAAHIEHPQAGHVADQPGQVGILDSGYGILIVIIGLGPERVSLERVGFLDDARREEGPGLLTRSLDALWVDPPAQLVHHRGGESETILDALLIPIIHMTPDAGHVGVEGHYETSEPSNMVCTSMYG